MQQIGSVNIFHESDIPRFQLFSVQPLYEQFEFLCHSRCYMSLVMLSIKAVLHMVYYGAPKESSFQSFFL